MSKVDPQALRTGSRDELVPDRSASVEKSKGELVTLGKGKDGASVKEGEQLLHQLRAPPKLCLCFVCHFLKRVGLIGKRLCDYGLVNGVCTAPETTSFQC